MKIAAICLVVLLSTTFCLGQSNAEMCNAFGLKVSYSYKKTENIITNPLTDTKFDEYIITCMAENSSGKCVGFKDPIVYLNLVGIDFGYEDNRFTGEKSAHMAGYLNHMYSRNRCNCVDSKGYNYGILITLCPNTKSQTDYTFVYPQGFTPTINWYECYIQQIDSPTATNGETNEVENEVENVVNNEEEKQTAELINLVEKRIILCDELGALLNEKNSTNSTYEAFCPKTDSDRLAYASLDDYTIEDIEWLQMQVNDIAQAIADTNNLPANEETYEEEDEILEAPEFPGGVAAFAQMISDSLNMDNITAKGEIRSLLQLTVIEDGTITDLETTGEDTALNNEVIKAATLITTSWKPARTKSGNVKYRMTLPIVFVFE